ncbi:hypothetical protein AAGS61_07110, partial [Lysinibacillus sp. KU-BSD001]
MRKTNYVVLTIAMIILLNLVHFGSKADAAGFTTRVEPTYDITYDNSGIYHGESIEIGYDPDYGVIRGALQFTLPALTSQIVKAELSFNVGLSQGNPFVAVYGSNDDTWSESNQHIPTANTNELGRVGNLANLPSPHVIDVTSFIKSQADDKVSFILQGETTGGLSGVILYSKEYRYPEYRPALTLTIVPVSAATPNIGTQPTDKTVNVGDSATLNVAASGGISLSYQWYKNITNSTSGGTLIPGATSATYAPSTGTAGTTYYYVVVTNTDNSATGNKTATATSNVAKVQVNALTHAATPNIGTQPTDKTVNVGGSATLNVAASGGVSLSYQWYSNTTNSNSGGTPIPGATSATYVAPTGTAGTTYYYVVVTNTDSSATGNKTATATSNVAKVQVNTLTHAATPSIGTQPTDKTVNVGDSAALNVAASGGVSLSYQWYKNITNSTSGGTLIPGATSATYAPSTGTAGTTYYYVVVTNTDNSATGNKTATATSNVAKVQVNALTHAATPNIGTHPTDQTVNVGDSSTLNVAASGGVSLSYQWYSNTTNSTSGGTLIPGATSATYAPSTVTAGTTYYYVVVTNTDNSATGQQTATATSNVAKVQVNALTHAATPNIGTHPTDQTVNVGESSTLNVAASGGVSLSYQWYSNTTNSTSGGTLIPGATSATY